MNPNEPNNGVTPDPWAAEAGGIELIPWFDNRDFSLAAQPPGVRFSTIRHSWRAVGGPDEAEILASGPEPALWSLVDLLRSPLKLFHPLGEPVWWGFVDRVEISAGGVSYEISLDAMTNRVRAWYRPTLPNTDYALPAVATGWVDDPLSQSVYGVKEAQKFLAENTGTGAAASRDIALAYHKYPLRSLRTEAGRPDRPTAARLMCKGWWHTTAWRCYEQPAGLAQLANPGGASLTPLGNGAYQQHLTTFTTPPATISWPAKKIYLRVGKLGNPADSLTVTLLDNANNSLATSTAAASAIGKVGWFEFPLNTAASLTANTVYKICIHRSGAQDAANYYRVEMDTSYQADLAAYWNGSAWVTFSPYCSLLFKVTGEEDSAVQLSRMLAPSAGGQFLPDQDLPISSGNTIPLWRDGKQTAGQEIQALLELGTGPAKYLAAVGQDRRLTIFPQLAPGAADYGLLRTGRILDPAGAIVRPGFVIAGVWMQAADIAPVGLIGPQMVDPARVFVEAMEWDNRLGRWLITPGAQER
ncbi:MAG TPA: hypothetical protein VGJ97_11700 [Anaerolineaceae bacterium]|jgi:hypothetical protein